MSSIRNNEATRMLGISLCAELLKKYCTLKDPAYDNIQNIIIDVCKMLTWWKSLEPEITDRLMAENRLEEVVRFENYWSTCLTFTESTPRKI